MDTDKKEPEAVHVEALRAFVKLGKQSMSNPAMERPIRVDAMARRLLWAEAEIERLRDELDCSLHNHDACLTLLEEARKDAARWREVEPRLPMLEAAQLYAETIDGPAAFHERQDRWQHWQEHRDAYRAAQQPDPRDALREEVRQWFGDTFGERYGRYAEQADAILAAINRDYDLVPKACDHCGEQHPAGAGCRTDAASGEAV